MIAYILLLAALLVPGIAEAQTQWTVNPPQNFNVINYTQMFSAPVNQVLELTPRQDLTRCSSPIVSRLTDDTSACTRLATMEPGVPFVQRISFSKGFIHLSILDAGDTSGGVTADCDFLPNTTFDGTGGTWVDTYTEGTCTAAP